MLKNGWPPDVIDDIRTDHRKQIERVYVLAINDAATYLGLSRYGVEKLIKTGKLRLFTIAPTGTSPRNRHIGSQPGYCGACVRLQEVSKNGSARLHFVSVA
jgi:hypothetical protein